MSSEFKLIQDFFASHLSARNDVELGIGDDAALLRVPAGEDLVVAMDTLVAGVHFPVDTAAADIGYKAVAVNFSDLAAMGAAPAWLTLALTLPAYDAGWLRDFAKGMFELTDAYAVALVGGDTTRGPLTITVQAHGFVPARGALRRDAARPDDDIYVSGSIGDAALALADLRGDVALAGVRRRRFKTRLDRPTPRVPLGMALRGIANAAIDVSDGLLQDLGHILEASAVGCDLDIDALPVADELRNVRLRSGQPALTLALAGGDDYELCFTAPVAKRKDVEMIAKKCATSVARVGCITAAPGLRCWRDGERYLTAAGGYDHFA